MSALDSIWRDRMEGAAMGRVLWDALGEIEDRRGRKGRQHPLRSVGGIAIAAMLAGANDLRDCLEIRRRRAGAGFSGSRQEILSVNIGDIDGKDRRAGARKDPPDRPVRVSKQSLRAIYRWGRRLKPEALALFEVGNGKAPCHATCHCFFQSLDADALSRALGRFATADAEPGHIAIDGKTLCGSRRLDAKAIHVLSAFSTDLGAVIGDLAVPPDQNEITTAMALLKALPLDGAIITGDAIFTQREICRHIREGCGDHPFVVKDNQPQLKAGVAEAFGDHSPLGPTPRGQRAAA